MLVILRWIALAPAVLLASTVANGVTLILLRFTILSPSLLPEAVSLGLATIIAAAVSGVALVLTAASVAPSRKRRSVKVVALAGAILMAVFFVVYVGRSEFLNAASRVGALLGIGAGYVFSSGRPGKGG